MFSLNFKSVFPSRTFYLPYLRNGWSNWCETKMKWVNWMRRWLGYPWPWPWPLTLKNSRSNCISGMGGSIVMERKGQESLGCPDVKHNHYVTPRKRILLPTGWLKMSAFPSIRLVILKCFNPNRAAVMKGFWCCQYRAYARYRRF